MKKTAPLVKTGCGPGGKEFGRVIHGAGPGGAGQGGATLSGVAPSYLKTLATRSLVYLPSFTLAITNCASTWPPAVTPASL